MTDTGMDYICLKPCGCCVAITADDTADRKQLAKDIAVWIRDGYTVEHVERKEAVERFLAYVKNNGCTHEPKQLSLLG